MILRLYRITDKLGVAFLKVFAAFGLFLLEGVEIAVGSLSGGLGTVLRSFWTALSRLFRGVLRLLRMLGRLLAGLFRQISYRLRRQTSAGGGAGASTRSGGAVGGMARRRAERTQAREAMDVGLVEDPLRRQNRTLSFLVVAMGFVLVGALIWATSLNQNRPVPGTNVSVANAGNGGNITFAEDVTPTATTVSLINTPIPTATSIPSILVVRGSIAYTARERGQTDLWAVNVGNTNPIRLTNDPADERDPAWSPDGTRLAYAARRDDNWELYVLDVTTQETTRLTYDLAYQANPSWSPDGVFLVYESYQGNNLDLYVVPVDGSELPQRLTDTDSPDFDPAWSPDGRRIAFVSWRNGQQDIYVYSLNDGSVLNLTNTVERHEESPAWSPGEGELLAYSALDEGIEKVFVKASGEPNTPAQVLERGRTPSWSPDGTSLVFAVDSIDAAHLVASPFTEAGVATEIIPVLPGSSQPTWTIAPLPASLANGGGLGPAVSNELFEEQIVEFDTDPPFRLDTLVGVEAPNPVLNDNVNDSFNALREAVLDAAGFDLLGELEDAFWRIDRPPQPGEERRNWHMTGRAFSINRNGIAGFPPPIEVVREDVGVNTYWRVYVRAAEQNGQLGEPLRQMPWDFAARSQGDVASYDAGGRLRTEMPEGYYVDLTTIVEDYGWSWTPSGRDWRANFNSTNFWMFRKTDGLSWFEAMREIYTEAQLGGFAPTPTPPPAVPLDDDGTDNS
jgi:TolB protein